jgi:ribosomal-protein-alanine N-acetyltransferase
MLEVNFTPFPTLVTERLILREATMDDAQEVFYLRSDADVIKYVDRDPAESIEEAKTFIQTLIDNRVNNTGISWNIVLKGTEKMIGNIALWRLDRPNYRAEIGYVLHPDHQGKGIMQEALQSVIHYGFYEMELHSIEANINPGNMSSQRLLERAGFVKEAHFRENYYYNGRFLDSAIYSLLTPKK